MDELVPYENNPRINDEAAKDVAESIEQCGNLDPIEVDENNVILSGHTRLKALIAAGYAETEVIKYTGLTEEQKRKYRLLANKTGEKAEWDFGKLEEELDGLDFGDFDFGFGGDMQAAGQGDSSASGGGQSDNGFNYKEQYGVIVMCASEAEQEQVYNDLTDSGYVCKVVAV